MEQLKFSIIIPVYNVARYVRAALDSVCRQTHVNWEAICVDDGSTDGSEAILDEYKNKDSRFKVIHQANAGVSAARNAALDSLTGDWALFLDADDVLEESALARIEKTIFQNAKLDLVRFLLKRFDENETCVFEKTDDDACRIFDVSKSIREMPLSGFTCVAYRADVVRRIRFEKYIVGEDLLLWTQVSLVAQTMGCLNATLYGYRMRLGSVSRMKETIVRIQGTIQTRKLILAAYDVTEKEVPYLFWKRHLNVLVENVPLRMGRLSAAERKLIRNEWLMVLRGVLKLHHIPKFHKYRIWIIVLCPCFVAILGKLPYQLKRRLK